MKYFIGLLFTLMMVSCGGEETISEKEARLVKEKKTEVVEPTQPSPEVYHHYEPASLSDRNGNSYWFVLVEDKDGGTRRSCVMKQKHEYFSFVEAREVFKEDVFVLNVIQVSKETHNESNN